MKKNIKYLAAMLMTCCLIASLTACGGKTVTNTDPSTDIAYDKLTDGDDTTITNTADDTGSSVRNDISNNFITEAYRYFTEIKGYDDKFATGIIAIMLVESDGNPENVEFSDTYADEYAEFMTHTDDEKIDLLDAYHAYGETILKKNEANTDMFRDDNGNFCPGVGIMLWTGNRGNDLIGSASDLDYKWTDLEYQLDYLSYQLMVANLTPDDDIVKNIESYEDAVNVVAFNFLMIPEDAAHLDEYMSQLDYVENIITDFLLDNDPNIDYGMDVDSSENNLNVEP